MIFGINTWFITSGAIPPPIERTIISSCRMVAFRSVRSPATISLVRSDESGFKPSTKMRGISSSPDSSSFFDLKFQEGAITCSMRSETVIAFNISLTATSTFSCTASGQAIRLVNCACDLPSQSRVQRPIICTTSVRLPRTPMVRQCSHHCQSKPSLAVPRAMIISTASGLCIRCRNACNWSRSRGLSSTKSATLSNCPFEVRTV